MSDDPQRPPTSALPAWSLPLFGGLAVIAGLAPWLATGARLPLQNLWAEQTLPGDMPLVAVPLSQYELGGILGMMIVGGALAGLLVRTAAIGRARPAGAWFAGVGAAVVMAAATVQSALVVAGGLGESRLAGSYLALVVAWTGLSALTALVLLVLIARAPRPGATIAWAVAAAPIATWAGLWLRPSLVGYSDGPDSPLGMAVTVLRWLPAIVLGAALAWCGLRRSAGVIAAWLVSLAILWLVPAMLTALTYVAGFRRPGEAWELVSSGVQVLGMALAPNLAGPPVLLALAIGVVGAVVAAVVRRDAAEPAQPVDPMDPAEPMDPADPANPPESKPDGAGAPTVAGVAGWPQENERNHP